MPSTDKCQPLRDALKDIKDAKEKVMQALDRTWAAEMRVRMLLEECESEHPDEPMPIQSYPRHQ